MLVLRVAASKTPKRPVCAGNNVDGSRNRPEAAQTANGLLRYVSRAGVRVSNSMLLQQKAEQHELCCLQVLPSTLALSIHV